MPECLPAVIDPRNLAEKRGRLSGSLDLSALDRLVDRLLEARGAARLDLRFGQSGRRAEIAGTVEAELVLQCQCCLGPVVFPVRSPVHLAVVASIDESLMLPDNIEALMVAPGAEVKLADIVQDELLLAVPAVPRHPDCEPPHPDPATPDRHQPFAILAGLKRPD